MPVQERQEVAKLGSGLSKGFPLKAGSSKAKMQFRFCSIDNHDHVSQESAVSRAEHAARAHTVPSRHTCVACIL